MKKLLNLLMILIVGVSTFLNIPSVNAASDHLYVDYSDGFTFAEVWNGNWISTPQNLIRRASDNSLVYCIQAHVVLADGASVVSSTDMNQLASRINRSPEAIDKVKLIAYYGYGYGNHTSIEWYMATQVAIWSVTDPDVYPTVARGNLTRTDRFDDKVNEILNLVNNHTTHPSFDRQTVTMNVGDTITLRDTNGVLSNYYNSVQNENYTATISGNDLILTAKRAYTGTINLDTKENTNPPTFWDGANQICWSGSDPAYTKANIKLETKVKTLFYKKYGKQKDGVYRPEKDAEFQIINKETNEVVETVITNEEGKAETKLKVGNYILKQTKGKKGYEFIKDYEFTVEEGSTGEMFFLNNEVIYYEVNLIKVDSEDNTKLEGATYSLYNDKDELIGEYTTNSEGIAFIKDLTIGKYYLIEKTAPEGHVLNTEKHEFTIDGDIKITEIVLEDAKIYGGLEFTKTEPIKESVEQIYTAVKQEVISNKQLDSSPKPVQSTENNKIEKIEYTDIRPNEEEAKEEIRKVTEELLKAQEIEENKEKIDNSKSELDKFEEEQEESAIISMEEFMKKGNTLYALNEEKQYKDEGNEPISLQDLEKRFTTINNFAEEIKQTTKVEEKPDTKKKVVLDDFNTINSMAYSEEHIFKNSPIISPIFGIEQNSSVENIELENTANYDKLDNEIRKTNEFLGKLKELKEKLN